MKLKLAAQFMLSLKNMLIFGAIQPGKLQLLAVFT